MVSSGGGAERKQHECLAWLYAQPEGSVVLLCFGSMGTFRGDRRPAGKSRERSSCLPVHPPTRIPRLPRLDQHLNSTKTDKVRQREEHLDNGNNTAYAHRKTNVIICIKKDKAPY
jgi:hypothetical protein